jgi:hypothetical protein
VIGLAIALAVGREERIVAAPREANEVCVAIKQQEI